MGITIDDHSPIISTLTEVHRVQLVLRPKI